MVRRALTLCAVVAVLGASASASASAVQASTPAGHRGGAVSWGAAHPTLATGSALLAGVTAVSADDVWAVGVEFFHSAPGTLVEHWDGTSWSIVPSPNPVGATYSSLESVDAISANNVWAVGWFERQPTDISRTLVEHWNGASWSRVPSPNVGSSGIGTQLLSVSAVGPGDVWAVGAAGTSRPKDGVHSVALRWEGGTWSITPTPVQEGVDRELSGVSAANSSSGWAVGFSARVGRSQRSPLVEHWNGQRWNQAPIARPGAYAELYSVSVVAPGNAWAVGGVSDTAGKSRPLVEHRTAEHWTQIRPPGLGGFGELYSISGAGPDDVWAVGTMRDTAVLAHWNGDSWTLFHGVAGSTAHLNAVTTHGTSATWAVGLRLRDFSPFAERWNGHVWTR